MPWKSISLALQAIRRNLLRTSLTVLGIVIGVAAVSMVLTKMMGVPYTFNLGINVLSFFFSAAIGILFGFMPAQRAAELNPIVVLRHE